MTEEQLYCDGPGQNGDPCGRAVARHGSGGTSEPKCSTHLRQLNRTGKMKPIIERVSPEEKLINAADALAQADPLDDADYEAKRRAVILAGKALGRTARANAIREGLKRAKAKGVRIGRPRQLDYKRVAKLLRKLKSPTAVARKLGIARKTVYVVARHRE